MKSNELIQNLTSNLKVVTPIKYKLKDYALVLLVGFFQSCLALHLVEYVAIFRILF
jgi:hypothetical protein